MFNLSPLLFQFLSKIGPAEFFVLVFPILFLSGHRVLFVDLLVLVEENEDAREDQEEQGKENANPFGKVTFFVITPRILKELLHSPNRPVVIAGDQSASNKSARLRASD